MMKHSRSLVALAFSGALSAQTVTVSAIAVSPFTVEATVGAQVVSSAFPSGPLPPFVSCQPAIPLGASGQAQAVFSFSLSSAPQPRISFEAFGNSFPLAGASVATSFGLINVLLQVQASSAVTANLVVERVAAGTAGAAIPIQRVDVGNDGTFEVTEASVMGLGVPSIALGPQPVLVRVLFQAGTVGPQSIDSRLRLQFVPENALSITQVISACGGDLLVVEPSFQGNGVDLFAQPSFAGDLTVAVIGLGVQPLALPASLPGCVLLPSPDVLFVMAQGGNVNLPIPTSVRPLLLWVQGAALELSGLGSWTGNFTTTQGHRLYAF